MSSSSESEDEVDLVDGSLVKEEKNVQKRKSPRVAAVAVSKKKATPAAVKRVVMKDQGSQTSPAFVKAAKSARKKSKVGANPEMEEFSRMAVTSAKKAVKQATKADENDFSNPTPAMLALMAKKAELTGSTKKRKKTKDA